MNILPVNSLNFLNYQVSQKEQNRTSLGLKMANPLQADTISFGHAQQTVKKMGNRADAISFSLAKRIRNELIGPHEQLKEVFINRFRQYLSDGNTKNLLTFFDRVKTAASICEKSATRHWNNYKSNIEKMTDVSGFCFLLEKKQSFSTFMSEFISMLEDGDIQVKEVEYHRLAPIYKSNKIIRTFDSLDQTIMQKMKKSIIDIQQPRTQFWTDVDSMSGYSAMHILVLDKEGHTHEVKIMTRGMSELQTIENLMYKIRNGKGIDKKYKYFEGIFEPLKVPDNERMLTDEQKKLQAAMTKYTQDAYIDILEKPFSENIEFLRPNNPLLKDFDFNNIRELVIACDKIAENS